MENIEGSERSVDILTAFGPLARLPKVYSRAVVGFGASSLSTNLSTKVVFP